MGPGAPEKLGAPGPTSNVSIVFIICSDPVYFKKEYFTILQKTAHNAVHVAISVMLGVGGDNVTDGNEYDNEEDADYDGAVGSGGNDDYAVPVFLPTPTNITVSPGDTASLKCRVENLGTNTVRAR